MTNWVLPSAIPFDTLKGKDLEECLYWLLEAMGAKNLEWRVGGEGEGAPDQGRDLEARFPHIHPDGEISWVVWRVEAKGRRRTVERQAVKDSVVDVEAHKEVDVLVIATNTGFSNPTRDWVRQWQGTHPIPQVRLWERADIERLLCKHPGVVLRLFSQALSLQGQMETVRSRFWNHLSYTDQGTLERLWHGFGELELTPDGLVAIIASEFASGETDQRPWATRISDHRLLDVLAFAAVNLMGFALRSQQAGINETPYYHTVGYLILASLLRQGTPNTMRALDGAFDSMTTEGLSRKAKDYLMSIPLSRLIRDMTEICTDDCERVIWDPPDRSKAFVSSYWNRLNPEHDSSHSKDQRMLVIENLNAPCKVGFPVGKDVRCPLLDLGNEVGNTKAALGVLEKVIRYRAAAAGLKIQRIVRRKARGEIGDSPAKRSKRSQARTSDT